MSFSVDTALRKARKHFENDDVVSARKIYQQILEKYPENQRAISGYNRASQSCESAHNPSLTQDEIDAVLGLFNKGLFEEAICKIYGLLEHHSTSYFLYNVLAVSQANSNHLEDAEAAFLMASKFASNKSEAYVNLANIQCKIGKIDKAITNYKQALESNPDELAALNNLGSLLVEKGQNQEAISILKRQIKIDPHQPKAFFSLSLAFKNIHQVEAAIGAAKRAIQLDRRFIEAYQNLGKLLIQTGRFEEAATILQTANKIAPENSMTLSLLGLSFLDLGKFNTAHGLFIHALSIDEQNIEILNNLAVSTQIQGKIEESKKWLNKAIKMSPHNPTAYCRLAAIQTFSPGDSYTKLMESLILDDEIRDKDKVDLYFALSRIYELAGETRPAFELLCKGNAIKKELLNYEVETDISFFEGIRSAHTALSKFNYIPYTSVDITPIFVLGMPRSGTTLVEQILSSHTQVFGAGELGDMYHLGHNLALGNIPPEKNALDKFRSSYLAKISKISNQSAFVVDKNPQNFYFIGLISKVLPEAKIVLMKRDGAAVCWSNFKTNFAIQSRSMGFSCDLDDVIEYYKQYRSLIGFWDTKIGESYYKLNYDQLIQNQEIETSRLLSYVGLEFEQACMKPHLNTKVVKTASYLQVREKIYTGSNKKWEVFKPLLSGKLDGL